MSDGNAKNIDPAELLRHLADVAIRLKVRDDRGKNDTVIRAEMLIRRIFGQDSQYLDRLSAIRFYGYGDIGPTWESAKAELASILHTAAEELDLFGVLANTPVSQKMPTSRKVFVVHGHEDGLKETIAAC
ncbi:MAG TPA: hypothetical protein VMR52_07175 [Dehalococcoidia bacterium]|nr:hypothetical protein [Dehalococcoidia bacterium]